MTRDQLLTAAQRRADQRADDAFLGRELGGLLTQREFAAMCRMSVDTIQRLAKKRIDGFPKPTTTNSRNRLYHRRDVEAWIATRALW